MNNIKKCTRCKKEQLLEEFTINRRNKDGRDNYCSECNYLWCKNWTDNNPEKSKLLKQKHHIRYRESRLKRMKEYTQELKQRVYDIYGNKCACCGETNREFFAVDHVGGGGTVERRKLGSRGIFLAALKYGFQKEKYQLLCHNCNMSLGFHGYCPHHPEIRRPVIKKYVPKSNP